MPDDEQNDQESREEPTRYASCGRKRKYFTRKAARRSARTAGVTHETRLRSYRCGFCGSFHLTTVQQRRAPPADVRERGAPSREREEAARANGRKVQGLLDARRGKGAKGMAIQMVPVESSNVRAVGLEGARLLVQFDNGVYECVREDGSETRTAVVYENFLASESKGRFYNEQIRRAPSIWHVRKLEEAAGASPGIGETHAGFSEPEGMEASLVEFSPPPTGSVKSTHTFVLDQTLANTRKGGQGFADFCSVCGLPRKHPIHLQNPQAEKAVENLRPLAVSAGWPIVGRCASCSFPLILVRAPQLPGYQADAPSRVICPTCMVEHIERVRELSTPTHHGADELYKTEDKPISISFDDEAPAPLGGGTGE